MTAGSLEHRRKVVAYFLDARSWQQGDNGTRGIHAILGTEGLAARHRGQCLGDLLHGWIAHIFRLKVVLGIPVGLEREYTIHLVDISSDILDTPLLPHPHLGRDEIVHLDTPVMGIVRQLEVKRWVVDEHKPVRAPSANGLLGCTQESQDGGQMLRHLDKAHVGHVAVVYNGRSACCSGHEVATQELKLRLAVAVPYICNQTRPM